jgi:hypothetical protein
MNNPSKNIFCVLFLLSTIFSAANARAEIHCLKTGKIKIQNSKEEKSAYCWDDKTSYLTTYDCHLNRKCKALTAKPDWKLPPLSSQYGTPMAHTCAMAAGTMKFMSYWDEKKWKDTSVCAFSDGSFVGLDYFVSHSGRR